MGSDSNQYLPLSLHYRFNPRSRVGSDWKRFIETMINLCVSIHAPAWEATSFDRTDLEKQQVSIHAPAWEATQPDIVSQGFGISFNPRSRVGSDLDGAIAGIQRSMFQSTLPRGKRHQHRIKAGTENSFNPRSRVGSDKMRSRNEH